MANITAQMVKELRERTGAGMMDCKAALQETNGDMEAAVDLLRKKGLAKAAKKAGRIAAEGLIGVATTATKGVLVEVNSETDFVARNEQFQDMVRKITSLAPKADGDLGKLLALTYPGKSVTVEEHVKETVATIGENMSVRRTVAMSVGAGHVAEYVHNKVADGLGKIGVLVALESTGEKAVLTGLGRQLAMHIAAAAPAAITAEELDPAIIERERAVYTEQAKASGKSPEIVAKMNRILDAFLKTDQGAACCEFKAHVPDDPVILGIGVGAGLRKEDTALKDKINAAIAALAKAGKFEEITNKYPELVGKMILPPKG
jgi:elongation factor Ts